MRPYRLIPVTDAITVEGRSPFDAEKRAREQHPHLRGAQLLVVAASLAWEREPDPSHIERSRRVEA